MLAHVAAELEALQLLVSGELFASEAPLPAPESIAVGALDRADYADGSSRLGSSSEVRFM
jgi:hypothetical protein